MDIHNTFFTPKTYQMVRLDWLFIMLALIYASVVNWQEINWWLFAAVFWWIDFVGTAPGMYFHKKNKNAEGEDVPRWAIAAYNICHSFTTISCITFIWYLNTGWQWEMLAMPMHLAADRSVFGNIYKNFGIRFDPQPIAEFSNFIEGFVEKNRKPYPLHRAAANAVTSNNQEVQSHV